jgi:hypothetical protein
MLIEQMTRYEGRQDPNAGRYLFLDAVQRMSQFIEGIAAPTFGDFGDEDEIGAALSWGRERPRLLHPAHFRTN